MSASGTMRAVVLKKAFEIVVEDRPVPTIQADTDVILKVVVTALCGSELHQYRGHSPIGNANFVMGHEFVGIVEEVGGAVKSFKKGDKVVSPFTTSCGECFQCVRGWSCRCAKSQLFGSPGLDGGQAEYVRVPLAETTLYPAVPGVPDELFVLLADILPTGVFAARSAQRVLNPKERENATVAVVGCGPVGLCAITAAKQQFARVFAIDSIPDRLAEAEKHGAKAFNLHEDPIKAIQAETDGRGPDAVLELVGHSDALLLAIDLVRVGGVVASHGVHNHEIPMKGSQLYNKNVRLTFGRCPVRDVFEDAMGVLKKETELFSSFIHKRVKLEDAPATYAAFNEMKIRKAVFTL